MFDPTTLLTLLAVAFFYLILFFLFLGTQWHILTLLFSPLDEEQGQEQERERDIYDFYNDPTQQIRAIR